MKKIISKTVFFSIVLTFVQIMASCTLDMTDWVEAEEDRGYGETVKEENDFYSVEYEYKENTRSLTDNIQEYIMDVEADSIIYFADNMPSEWLPEVGGCVVANCGINFPMGLVSRVLSVEKTAGMYKVVTTPAELEDAFEDFDLDMDMDVISGTSELTKTRSSSSGVTRSGEKFQEDCTIDWTMFNLTSKKEKVINRNGTITRADDDEEYYDKDVDKDTTYTTETLIFSIDDNTPLVKQALAKIPKEAINKFSISLYSLSKSRIQKKVRVKTKYEYTKQTETSGMKLSYVVGHNFAKIPKSDKTKKKEAMDDLTSWLLETGRAAMTEKMSIKDQIKDERQFLTQIPLGSLPFGIIIRVKPILDLDLSIVGTGDVIFWNSKTVTESEISNGNKKKDSEPKKMTAPSNEYDANIAGKFGISGGLEAFVGVGKKVGVGLSARAYGIGFFGAFTIDLVGNFNKTIIGDETLAQAEEAISLSANVEVGCKALGGKWGEFKFLTKKWRVWDGWHVNYYPTVSMENNINFIFDKDAGGEYKKFVIKYQHPDLGIMAGTLNALYHPKLRLYKGKDMSGEFIEKDPDSWVEFVHSKRTYTYTYKTYDLAEEMVAVPVLKMATKFGNSYTIFKDHQRYITPDAVPTIEYKLKKSDVSKGRQQHIYQRYGDHPTTDMGIVSGIVDAMFANQYQYDFAVPFYFYNAPFMSNYWSDFGIHYIIHYGKNKKEKFKSLKSKVKKSGLYVPNITFITNQEGVNKNVWVEAELYYVDKLDESNAKRYLVGNASTGFMSKYYTYWDDVPGVVKLELSRDMVYPFEDTTIYDWEENGKIMNITAF